MDGSSLPIEDPTAESRLPTVAEGEPEPTAVPVPVPELAAAPVPGAEPGADESVVAAEPDPDPVEEAVAEAPAADVVAASIDGLRVAVERFHERSRADEDVIARMQERIESLQADQVRALLGPVVNELAALLADFTEAAELDYPALGLDRVAKEFSYLGTRVENALDLLGVASVDAQPGLPFDSRVHQAVRQVATADPVLDKTIASVQRQGFTFAHAAKPALYARVTVYAYAAPEPEPEPATSAEVAPEPAERLPATPAPDSSAPLPTPDPAPGQD